MSLIDPGFIARHWPKFMIGLAALLVLGFVLWLFDVGGRIWGDRQLSKDKQQIANTAKEIANLTTEIANLEQQRAEKRGELNRDMETLANNTFGLEEAKKATNAALANFNAAVNANSSDVDRTADDLERVLRQLEGQ